MVFVMEAVQLALPTTTGLGCQGVPLNYCYVLMCVRQRVKQGPSRSDACRVLGDLAELFLGALFMGQPRALISLLCSTHFTNSHPLHPHLLRGLICPRLTSFLQYSTHSQLFLCISLPSLRPSGAGMPLFFVHDACIPGIVSLLS